jgi:hypothetical protein
MLTSFCSSSVFGTKIRYIIFTGWLNGYANILEINMIPYYFLLFFTQNAKIFFSPPNYAFNLGMKKSDSIGIILGLVAIVVVLIAWYIKWINVKPIA